VQKGSFQLELYPIKSAQRQGERISKLISLAAGGTGNYRDNCNILFSNIWKLSVNENPRFFRICFINVIKTK